MPIDLDDIRSGYNLSKINSNFQRIENAWDEKLDRLVNDQGNQMEQDIDMNSYRLINYPPTRIEVPTDLVRVDAISQLGDYSGYIPEHSNFTGNGVTTTFPKPIPDIVNAKGFEVYLGGLRQEPNVSYYLSGDDIVFNTAPVLGVSVDIYAFNPVLEGTNIPDGSLFTFSYSNIADMILDITSPTLVGQLVIVADYYGGSNPNNSGLLTFKVVPDGTGVVDGGKYIQGNGVRFEQQMSGPFNVRQWGARADAILSDGSANPTPTDNAPMFQAASNFLSSFSFPWPQFGSLEFPAGLNEGYATSGMTDICECPVQGYNTPIIPIGNPDYIFRLNLRHTTNTRRFTQGWKFDSFRLWTDRGFTTTVPAPDCGHLLKIDGGWLIRSEITNLNCEPGFACRSVVDWDLTHPDIGSGVTEVGVPDANIIKNISTQYAQPSPYALSFTGDGLGTGSRLSSTLIENIYSGSAGQHEFLTWNQSINDFGAVRINETSIGRGDIRELFSGTHSIRMFGTSRIADANLELYVEFNSPKTNDFESILRGGTYENCSLQVRMYTENVSLQASPRSFFATFINCVFKRMRYTFQSQITNPPNADLINLGVSSYGNTFENKPDFFNQPEDPGMPWILRRMSLPTDTNLQFLDLYLINRNARQVITTDGSYVVGTIPRDSTEINAALDARFTLTQALADTADITVTFGGGGITSPRSSAVFNMTNTGRSSWVECGFVGRSDITSDPAPDQFSTNAMFSFRTVDTDGNYYITAGEDLNIRYDSGDYEVILEVANLTGPVTVNNLRVNYGQSNEYVNWL